MWRCSTGVAASSPPFLRFGVPLSLLLFLLSLVCLLSFLPTRCRSGAKQPHSLALQCDGGLLGALKS